MTKRKRPGGIREAAAAKEAEIEKLSPTTTLEVDVAGGGGRKYVGKFRYKVPTMGDRVDISAMKARYLTQLENVQGLGEQVAEALSYLHVTIEDEGAPDWWASSNQGIELYDFQPLMHLYAEARAYERKFLGTDTDAGEGAGEASDESGDDGQGAVVDDIPPAAERREVLAEYGPGSS